MPIFVWNRMYQVQFKLHTFLGEWKINKRICVLNDLGTILFKYVYGSFTCEWKPLVTFCFSLSAIILHERPFRTTFVNTSFIFNCMIRNCIHEMIFSFEIEWLAMQTLHFFKFTRFLMFATDHKSVLRKENRYFSYSIAIVEYIWQNPVRKLIVCKRREKNEYFCSFYCFFFVAVCIVDIG